ncbi:response regulator [Acaryochloris marina NIES-2412]|uniref:response regulator n=1 Tax=Acaryochloris marina TaxID=155978 RepID=UPI0040596587
MNVNFLEYSILQQSLIKDVVVIMEDSTVTYDAIKNILYNKLGWEVIKCSNQDEVVALAKSKKVNFFILDSWVNENKQEGLDALERVKQVNKQAYVAIYSAHSFIKDQAYNLKCNLFVKKDNINLNVLHITSEMLKYRMRAVEEVLTSMRLHEEKISDQRNHIKALELSFQKNVKLDRSREEAPSLTYSSQEKQDKNKQCYKKFRSNQKWREKYSGMYVAFVDGDLAFSEKNKDKFFGEINKSDKYKKKSVFIVKIDKNIRIIEEPTSIWFSE